jgi:hypothetical protein
VLGLLLLIHVLALALPIWYLSKRGRGHFFHPVVFHGIVSLLYLVPVGLDLLVFDGEGTGFQVETYLLVGSLYVVGAGLAMLTALVLPQVKTPDLPEPAGIATPTAVGAAISLAGSALYAVFLLTAFDDPLALFDGISRLERYKLQQGRGFLTMGVWWVGFGMLLSLAARDPSSSPLRSYLSMQALVLGSTGAFFVFLGDRLALAFLYLVHRQSQTFNKIAAIGLLPGVLGLHLFSFMRTIPGWAPWNILPQAWNVHGPSLFNMARSELGAPLKAIKNTIVGNFPGEPFVGLTFLESPLHLIPSVVSPFDPVDPAALYVQMVDPQLFAEGGGLAFPLYAEGIVNWGMAGVIPVGLLVGGLLWGANVLRRTEHPLPQAMYALAIGLILVIPRAPMQALIVQGFATFGLPAAIAAVLFIGVPHTMSDGCISDILERS